MSNYFRNFPIITYNNTPIKNITARVKILDFVSRDPFAFLPYQIQYDERPEDVAFYYYDSVDYVWLVLISNNIIDPFTNWPLSEENFYEFLKKKYATRAEEDGYSDVLEWATTTNPAANNVVFKRNLSNPDVKVSPESEVIASEWEDVRIFDYETEVNESKRNIVLLDRRYKDQAKRELKELLLR